MKKITIIGLLVAGVININSNAQTNGLVQSNTLVVATNTAGQVSTTAAAPSVTSFFGDLGAWVGSRDLTKTTFNANHGSAYTGADYLQGINSDALVGLEYKFGTNSPWLVQSVTRNAAIAGAIVGQEGGAGYNVIHNTDMELGGFVGGGYTFADAAVSKGAYGYVKAEGKKALGTTTFAGGYIEEQFGSHKQNMPIIGLIAGFTF